MDVAPGKGGCGQMRGSIPCSRRKWSPATYSGPAFGLKRARLDSDLPCYRVAEGVACCAIAPLPGRPRGTETEGAWALAATIFASATVDLSILVLASPKYSLSQ